MWQDHPPLQENDTYTFAASKEKKAITPATPLAMMTSTSERNSTRHDTEKIENSYTGWYGNYERNPTSQEMQVNLPICLSNPRYRGLKRSERDRILQLHNDLRHNTSVAKFYHALPLLEWDHRLEEEAQRQITFLT